MAGNDKLSTVNGETCTLMRVVHPSGSSAGVWRLQPNSEPDEQPTESSHLEKHSSVITVPSYVFEDPKIATNIDDFGTSVFRFTRLRFAEKN